jgi:hypothetical protein
MFPTLYVGADVRVEPVEADPDWAADRRDLYLLRREVVRPLSVDPRVWARPAHDATRAVDPALPWVTVDETRRRYAARSAVVGAAWVVVALGAVPHDGPARATLAKRGITDEIVLDPSWSFLGYDVAGDVELSGLSNCGYDGEGVDALRTTWSPRLNEHGLIENLDDALELRTITDARVPEHAPFGVIGLWCAAGSAARWPKFLDPSAEIRATGGGQIAVSKRTPRASPFGRR